MLTYKKHYNGEPIATKNGLSLEEQETGILLRASEDRAFISSHNPSIVRALLSLPFFEVEEVELSGNKRKHVVGVSGTIPIGAISIKTPRQSNDLSRVVSSAAQTPHRSPSGRENQGVKTESKRSGV